MRDDLGSPAARPADGLLHRAPKYNPPAAGTAPDTTPLRGAAAPRRGRTRLLKLLLLFVGAGLGGVLRHGLSSGLGRLTASSLPLGTLAVNVLGCLAIGFLATAFNGPLAVREEYRVAVLIGVLGGFTTFSAFGHETWMLATQRDMGLALLNLLLGNGLGLGAVWLGTRAASGWWGVE
jgi:CrcB protein